MELLHRINSLPLLRQHGIPEYLKHVCLITIVDELDNVPVFHQKHPWLSIGHIALVDGQPTGHYTYKLGEKNTTVPVGDLTSLFNLSHLEKIIITPKNDVYAQIPGALCRILAPIGIRNFYVYSQEQLKVISKRIDPHFLNKNFHALNRVYSLLADEASRDVFAARIKAVITGDPSYLPIAGHPEYFHPVVYLEAGDILIDGGISDNVDVQIKFAKAVGESGKIYGFEPIPDMFNIAKLILSAYPQYQINCEGLASRKGKTNFTQLGDSSHISNTLTNTVECEITSIDEFVQENELEKVDCIKLDIEGAEFAALLGARKTIKRFKPKLIICLYHKNEDLFELPAFIKKLAPEYNQYIAHSSYHFIDTILYAKASDQTARLA